ncbi:hypothetical protein ACNS7O_00915 [Haloferacaceae archaeon DSL9]
MEPVTLLFAVCLAAVHLFAGELFARGSVSHRVAVSVAGGVSVAYVFVRLLPELDETQRVLEAIQHPVVSFFEYHAYLVALIGFSTFYGLERLGQRAATKADGDAAAEPSAYAFWVHVASFGCYNATIGYLLVDRLDQGFAGLLFFAVAMALHFLVTDYGLRRHHRTRYRRDARWLLAGSVLFGWGLAQLVTLSEIQVVVPTAFLAGGVLLNVVKEELPAENEGRFAAFVVGAGWYSLLLLFV